MQTLVFTAMRAASCDSYFSFAEFLVIEKQSFLKENYKINFFFSTLTLAHYFRAHIQNIIVRVVDGLV